MSKRLFAAPRRSGTSIVVACALFIVFVSMGAFALLRREPVRVDPGDHKQVALGKRLYANACASCHGANLEGQPDWQRRLSNGRLPAPPHDAGGHTWHHSDAFLIRVTKLGPAAYPAGYQTDMPAFADVLTDREIAAILAYIKSEWPADIRSRQNRLNAEQ